jgi:hypothetical protein
LGPVSGPARVALDSSFMLWQLPTRKRFVSQDPVCACINITATLLLRRYLASRCDDPLLMGGKEGGGATSMTAGRRPGAVQLQPSSLAGSVLYSSPLSARSLSLSGRGKLADRGTVYTSKVRGEPQPPLRSSCRLGVRQQRYTVLIAQAILVAALV